MAEEQPGAQSGQDPVQAGAPASTEPVQFSSDAPWAGDLAQFGDQAGAVDQYLRSRWQPRVTQLEQQYAESAGAREFLGAFEQDAEAANVAVNRQLYGDEYGDALAASLGRVDLMMNPQGQQTQQPVQQAVPQQAAPQQSMDPRLERMLSSWEEDQQQRQYDDAKAQFLSDPQYADIDSELFDPFIHASDTWDEAVNMYRSWAAHYASRNGSTETGQQEVQTAPPTIGSNAGGAPGSTPSVPDYSQMRDPVGAAIDDIFSEAKPVAPPVMGGQ